MRSAVLDLGSNSFHVLVADLEGRSITPVLREREMLHLGRAAAAHGGAIPVEARDRAAAVVAHLMELARRNGAEGPVAVATAAIRDATNGPEVLAVLSEAAGLEVRVLSGDEEARLAYQGVRAAIAVRATPVLVLDLGGGSLEFAIGTSDHVMWTASTRLGPSALSATVSEGALEPKELDALHERIDAETGPLIDEIRSHSARTAVAVGGTVRALARLFVAKDALWTPASVNQLTVPTAAITTLRDRLVSMDVTDRVDVPGMKDRRTDHIHIAAVVLSRVFEQLQLDEVLISDWGLREGLLLETHGTGPAVSPARLRLSEVERIRRAFVPDDPHPVHVAMLARQLFDATTRLHGLGDEDRELLDHAARLHAIGEVLALRRQHLHAAYLVENAELRGFSPIDAAILTTLVRFHPSRGINPAFPPYASLHPDDRERADRLLPLLQAADGLDRAHDQAVDGVEVTIDGDRVSIALKGGRPLVTAAELERRLALFEQIYGVEVAIPAALGP